MNQAEHGRSTIKLPPSERKRRAQSRKEKEGNWKRLQGAGTFMSGKGGRRPKPIRSGRPSASKALAKGTLAVGHAFSVGALKSTDEPNPRQLTRTLMAKHPESRAKATPALSKISTMPGRGVGDQLGSAPSSGKATATINTMAEFKEMMAYRKQCKAMKK